MSYVVESGSSQRARKRRRTAVTLLIAVALLAGAFYYASTYFKKQPTAAAACATPTRTTPPPSAAPGAAPAPGQITVNVYNSTGRPGLAGDAAKVVKARGFVVGTVGNDPAKKQVAGTAEVRYGKNGEAAAKVVSALVTGAAPVTDARADASVDLVLGNAFTAVAAPPAPPAGTAGATAAPTSPRC